MQDRSKSSEINEISRSNSLIKKESGKQHHERMLKAAQYAAQLEPSGSQQYTSDFSPAELAKAREKGINLHNTQKEQREVSVYMHHLDYSLDQTRRQEISAWIQWLENPNASGPWADHVKLEVHKRLMANPEKCNEERYQCQGQLQQLHHQLIPTEASPFSQPPALPEHSQTYLYKQLHPTHRRQQDNYMQSQPFPTHSETSTSTSQLKSGSTWLRRDNTSDSQNYQQTRSLKRKRSSEGPLPPNKKFGTLIKNLESFDHDTTKLRSQITSEEDLIKFDEKRNEERNRIIIEKINKNILKSKKALNNLEKNLTLVDASISRKKANVTNTTYPYTEHPKRYENDLTILDALRDRKRGPMLKTIEEHKTRVKRETEFLQSLLDTVKPEEPQEPPDATILQLKSLGRIESIGQSHNDTRLESTHKKLPYEIKINQDEQLKFRIAEDKHQLLPAQKNASGIHLIHPEMPSLEVYIPWEIMYHNDSSNDTAKQIEKVLNEYKIGSINSTEIKKAFDQAIFGPSYPSNINHWIVRVKK